MAVNLRFFISLLAAAVNDTLPPAAPPDPAWDKLFALAKLHCVEALFYRGVQAGQYAVPEPVMAALEHAQLTAIAMDNKQRSAAAAILRDFEAAGIDCMPLKGLIMKELYPLPYLRSMCDMDILFRTEDAQRVCDALTALGFTAMERGGNPEVYEKGVISIEMHKALIRDKTDHFAETWSRAVLRDGYRHIYDMSKEDFYIFMMAHLRKHYVGSGVGLRAVLDIRLYEQAYGDALDRGYIRRQFEQSGFGDFPDQIVRLSEIWFGGKAPDPALREMEWHLITSGAFGYNRFSQDEYIRAQTQEKGRLRYALSLVFPGPAVMQEKYPVLQKAPFLLPIGWAVRGVSSGVFGAKKSLALLKKVLHTDEAQP